MSVQLWTWLIVGVSFTLYAGIAVWSRVASTKEFYVAEGNVHPVANGMATAADWMSAASFLGMAGIIAFAGRDGGIYLMGWTGGYVLLALLLAPYLRKFGKYTVPDFIGDRYYSSTARVVAVLCAIFISFTYVAGQMRGVGVVFSRFLEVDITLGVLIGTLIVFMYAVMGGMKGITYTQVAQYCVLIFAYLVPAIFISIMLTGNPVPQLGLGGNLVAEPNVSLLDKLDGMQRELGFDAYTAGSASTIEVFCVTMALMAGTAGLPHVIIRFYTVPDMKAARTSAGWALLFIAILYTTAPAVAVFAKTNFITTVHDQPYREIPSWFKTWESAELIGWVDKDSDGRVDYRPGPAFARTEDYPKPTFQHDADGREIRGEHGQLLLHNPPSPGDNEVYVDRDIMVLANPEIAQLPNWVIGLVAAGALAAALSTAAGLLLVISTAVAHDFCKRTVFPNLSEKGELLLARIAAAAAVMVAAYLGINPPGFVAEVVAFAFGLAAASFFPAILLGIFVRRVNREGAVAGMLAGITFTAAYIIYFAFINPTANQPENWLWGISPKGIGTLGMLLNFAVTLVVTFLTPPPPREVQQLVENIRVPVDFAERPAPAEGDRG
ncbi:MAG: sodium:solute symporter family protein [Verrucomicrobiota bacterium]